MMKRNIFYITLLTLGLFSCGSNDSGTTSSDVGNDEAKVELSFNMPNKEVQQLTNATGKLTESYGFGCLDFKGDNGTIKIYISSLDLKEQEYPVDVENLDSPNILASYKISSGGETSNCCGKVVKTSVGSVTITSVTSTMISGKIDVDNYDGSAVKGSFSFAK